MTEIRMSKDQRQYLINGKVYSRVSDVASAGEKPYLEQWRKRIGEVEAERISRETGEYGELVHEITMYSDTRKYKKTDRMLDKHEELLLPLISWQQWVSEYIEKWILIEQVIWSNKWMCAGRVDRVGIIVGDKWATIVDLKTGSLNDDVGVQIYGGYLPIYNEWRVKQRMGLPKATRAMAISLPRKNPGTLIPKEYNKEKYIIDFKSKAELFMSINR